MCFFCFSPAQAGGSWGVDACCAVSGNDCSTPSDPYSCVDRSASSNFLFRLQPGEPERFLPKGGTGDEATEYQWVQPGVWPNWGYNDLGMGYSGPPGTNGLCAQGGTYAGSSNEACGGGPTAYGGNGKTWGPTDVEVWFLED